MITFILRFRCTRCFACFSGVGLGREGLGWGWRKTFYALHSSSAIHLTINPPRSTLCYAINKPLMLRYQVGLLTSKLHACGGGVEGSCWRYIGLILGWGLVTQNPQGMVCFHKGSMLLLKTNNGRIPCCKGKETVSDISKTIKQMLSPRAERYDIAFPEKAKHIRRIGVATKKRSADIVMVR